MKNIKNIALLFILITASTGCSDTYLDTVPTSSTSTKQYLKRLTMPTGNKWNCKVDG